MKSLHGVLCAIFISIISMPMFGMQCRAKMDEATWNKEMGRHNARTRKGMLVCGTAGALAACCCSQDAKTACGAACLGALCAEAIGTTIALLRMGFCSEKKID